jgi:hypothetical protein
MNVLAYTLKNKVLDFVVPNALVRVVVMLKRLVTWLVRPSMEEMLLFSSFRLVVFLQQ